MNTKDFAKTIASQHGVTEKVARDVIDGLLDGIAKAMTKGEEVSLPGFGKFKRKETPAREGRNPATGAAMQIAASSKVTFTPAKALKDKL